MAGGFCQWCGEWFTGRHKQRFCSKHCASMHQYRDQPRREHSWGGHRPPVDAAHRRLRRELLPHAIGQPCPECGTPMDETAQLDHIVPRALGGQSTRDNVRMLCRGCNHRLGSELGNQRQREARGVFLAGDSW